MDYMLKRWPNFTCFLKDGQTIPCDKMNISRNAKNACGADGLAIAA
jgi:hypothetical protein